ncbi:RNA methyltransferase, TrmH family [Desulfonispora thiosulfatigenes DSM 11270]|uniref:RNA methyltransferase, TrmH family n=1 Tax=Desulfonispora thiosulfatigenes DSM 11270 TaxID=656914 RepID=A0A1W1VSA7_DESTI|nr:RNA methyltransferase [Desulfonispora thiosulfatigenes]SMB95981.1 RNA methyltransferase, TrmH family [Desulfonispora thiosulfatigenes DSM 11270]
MDIINSEQNHWIKKLKALHKRKYRQELNQFVIEGFRFCEEALKSQANIECLLVSDELLDNDSIKNLLLMYEKEYFVVNNKLLAKNLFTVNPQGIAAIINKPQWDIKEVYEKELILIIDGVQDPGNLGTIFRTALGAGVGAIFCIKGTVDIYNEKTLRSTMGAIFSLPIFYIENPTQLSDKLKNEQFTVVVADINGTEEHFSYNYPKKVAVVLGNEANGPLNFKKGDITISIPLDPKAESLNVAVAAGIIIYEIVRQHR